MAGAGFKTFVDGDILTAAEVNTYLMEQSVMVFASAAARTTAIAAPSEGMVTYRTDNNIIEYYDGAAWQPILDQDVIAAKGDLIVGTGDDTVAALTVGTNGHVLTADSSTATGLKWAAAPGGGKVLQVVSTAKSDSFTTTSTTFTDLTGMSVSITPSSATSKILIHVSIHGAATSGTNGLQWKILRGATDIAIGDAAGNRTRVTGEISTPDIYTTEYDGMTFLDSPATTSAITYKIQLRANLAGTVYVNRSQQDNNLAEANRSFSSITVLEIGA